MEKYKKNAFFERNYEKKLVIKNKEKKSYLYPLPIKILVSECISGNVYNK